MQFCPEQIPPNIKRVFVAYSGGLDSAVLLHLARACRPGFEVIGWHINHGLIEAADDMERFCVEQARCLDIELRVDRLQLGRIESNIEAEARQQRYALFARKTRRGDCILTAHHADDQAETFLLNALRGSGSAGLRGIAASRWLNQTLLLRPLLEYSREDLEAYAAAQELAWFNDPSNRSNRFDRNYLRNEVIPLIRQRWPRYQASLATSAGIQAETQDLLDEIAASDFEQIKSSDYEDSATLAVDGLLQFSGSRRHNLVRYWIARAGFAALTNTRMRELMQQLKAKPGSMPRISMPDYSLRVYDRRLFLVRDRPAPDFDAEYRFGQTCGIDIDAADLHLTRAQVFERLRLEDRNQDLVIRFRRQGEKNSDRHRLKRLYQSLRVPPWQRASVAQVYLDGKLAGLLT